MSEEKMNLKANREVDLSMYAYIVRPGANVIVPIPQDVKLVIAYTEQEALENISKQYPPGTKLTVDKKNSIPMKNILEMFDKVVERGGEATNMESEKPKVKTKADYYSELLDDLTTIGKRRYKKEDDFAKVQKIINDLRPLVNEALMWQQIEPTSK